ncbi:hypothetical protein EJ05DRAFT_506101 [Pseudovirgaria hyperparasitica]|uniref:MADS-box domain-containing protein n=1 Tax=Pseudovirgaria hyperparasitica TaxID=470096 RepID=A0A6A6VRG1_9PEZI|nr:uncharacterized protein EJ05DRAFT_506101 [Pseudovirgaria hyperparasitica]KAF2752376.1 hypothetical protein EJ05DRAFT_506101 [Pseudovirgaria hyperparasitica]
MGQKLVNEKFRKAKDNFLRKGVLFKKSYGADIFIVIRRGQKIYICDSEDGVSWLTDLKMLDQNYPIPIRVTPKLFETCPRSKKLKLVQRRDRVADDVIATEG